MESKKFRSTFIISNQDVTYSPEKESCIIVAIHSQDPRMDNKGIVIYLSVCCTPSSKCTPYPRSSFLQLTRTQR